MAHDRAAPLPERVVAGRFRVVRLAGQGGMGAVYQAIDAETGRTVALKVLSTDRASSQDIARFEREASLLEHLRHPGIVAHVAHGATQEGIPYLAMEWLDGEDLAARFARGPLAWPEAELLARRVAGALEVAHRAGIVHRDLKPSNLFLVGGEIARVTLLDFGIARRASSRHLTATGLVLGTPEYMAPEQARALDDVGPQADVFSLGCVLYQALTGRSPFAARHVSAILAKILFEDPQPPSRLRAELPAAADALLAAMLAKDPARRPRDAGEVLALLDRSAAESELTRPLTMLGPWSGRELRLVSVIMATAAIEADGATLVSPGPAEDPRLPLDTLERAEALFPSQAARLADGSLVVTVTHVRGEARDLASHAARCALEIREAMPGAAVAIATGRGALGEQAEMSEAFERAAGLLRDGTGSGRAEQIFLDEVTAGLIEPRYLVEQTGEGPRVLAGEDHRADTSRLLLGQPTPCVGREQELGVLEVTLSVCAAEAQPQAVLVTGAPGQGKSRLRRELLRRIAERGVDALVLLGQADPLASGSPYGLLGRVLRGLFGVTHGEAQAERRARILGRVAASVPPPDAERVAMFLGELCGAPIADEGEPRLRAARHDPRVMGDQIRLAFLDFLRAEGAARPVLLILEDVQWADGLSLRLVEAASRELPESPLMVLAMGRPEAAEGASRLSMPGMQHLSLRALGRRAAERLAASALGPRGTPTLIGRIVELAGGNPLLLEELIRAAYERGEGSEALASETLMALFQARIGQLDPEARRVLRAGSVAGESFSMGCAGEIAGLTPEELEPILERLIRAEVIEEAQARRFSGDRELCFRHALMREAAYSLLPDEDRFMAHRAALAFLERAGEEDATVLAEHARRGGEPERAVVYDIHAAERALLGNGLAFVLARAELGLACQPSGEARGALLGLAAAAHLWGSDYEAAHRAGREALGLLPRGGRYWHKVVLTLLFATIYLGLPAEFAALMDEMREATPDPDALAEYVEAASFLIVMASLTGRAADGRAFLDRLYTIAGPALEREDAIRGWVHYAHGVYCHWIEGDLWRKKALSRVTLEAAERIGDRRMRGLGLVSLGMAEMALGEHEAGRRTFEEALAWARSLPDEHYLLGSTTAFFAQGLVDQEDPAALDEAIALARTSLASCRPTEPAAGLAAAALALALLARGEREEAEEHARRGLRVLAVEPAARPLADAALARALIEAGWPEEARAVAEDGYQALCAIGGSGVDLPLRAALAEARRAAGDIEGARAAIAEAGARLDLLAGKIPDEEARAAFLSRVPLNREVARRARDVEGWLRSS